MPTNLPMMLVDKSPAIKSTDELQKHGLLQTTDGCCSLCGRNGVKVIPIARAYPLKRLCARSKHHTPVPGCKQCEADLASCKGFRCAPICDEKLYNEWIAAPSIAPGLIVGVA